MPASRAWKHKGDNKHRFLTFTERLSLVSVDAVHRISRSSGTEGENESKFNESLLKWRDQDRSLPFRQFYSEVEQKSKNYLMVVHYKDDITKSLLHHIALPDSIALESLCEVLVALCMDLRSELYPFFSDIFNVLTKLLATKDLERMEWIFSTISLLFKYLWRYMVTDIDRILTMYSCLLTGEHPAHISRFAAESLSFLLRKASSQNNVFRLLFQRLKNIDGAAQGVANVIFYVLKSTKGQLHSCTEKVLPKLLSTVTHRNDEDTDFGLECVNIAIEMVANHIDKQHSPIVWNILFEKLENYILGKELDQALSLLKVINTWTSYNDGLLMSNSSSFPDLMKQMLSQSSTDNSHFGTVLMTCKIILLAKKTNISSSIKESFLESITHSVNIPLDTMLLFWKQILSFLSTNLFAQSQFLKFCQNNVQEESLQNDIFGLLTEYILSQNELPKDGKELIEYLPRELNFLIISRIKGLTKIQSILTNILSNADNKLNLMWCSLLILHHVRPIPVNITKVLSKLYKRYAEKCRESSDNMAEVVAVTRMILQASVILDKKEVENTLNLERESKFIKWLITNHSKDSNALLIVDTLFCLNDKLTQCFQSEDLVLPFLYNNLSSHTPILRKLSLRILITLKGKVGEFVLCLEAEHTPASLQEYRKKALYLGRLKRSEDMEDEVSCTILKYLVSNFYVNFSAYWPCVQEVICSFMPETRKHPLWTTLFDLLELSSENCKLSTCSSENRTNTALSNNTNLCVSTDSQEKMQNLFNKHGVYLTQNIEMNSRVDHFNHRLLMWQLMSALPHPTILESFNRRIVQLFFDYLDKEHYTVDKVQAPKQNICINIEKPVEKLRNGRGKKDVLRMLEAFLKVFSRFSNPVSSAESMKLRATYEQFLMHDESNIQQWALKCLFTFKDKGISSFKDTLMTLLDDGKTKSSMLNLNLSEITGDEREAFIPVLLRLMYGRITSKSSLGSHGKSQGNAKRSIILRFLSGLTQEEMQKFIYLSIGPLSKYVQDEDLQKPLSPSSIVYCEPSNIIPLSRQQGILNTLQEIIEKHRSLLSNNMFDYLLKLLLSLYFSYNKFLHSIKDTNQCKDLTVSAAVDKRFSPYLRSLLKLAHTIINNLIEIWPDNKIFSKSQVESIFYVLVDPHLHKMKHECISQPNLLLHFFEKFSQKSKFFPLLAYKARESIQNAQLATPMDGIIEVLAAPKSSPSICRFIMDILMRMIQKVDEDTEKDLLLSMYQKINNEVYLEDDDDVAELGLRIVSKYTKEIMDYFIQRMKDKRKYFSVMQTQLKILCTLGSQVKERNLSLQLAELLLSNISSAVKLGDMKKQKESNSEKSLVPALTTLSAIAWHSELIPSISRLFSRLQSRECRLLLVDILATACQGVSNPTLQKCLQIIRGLNSWDKRFIEEIDYDSRLVAFQELNNWLQSKDATNLLENEYLALIPLLHTSLFTLFKHSSDLSLKESASRALELIIDLLMRDSTSETAVCLNNIINTVLLPAIQIGVDSAEETQRHECSRLLVRIAKRSPKNHHLHEITILCNKTDPDADFFENVQHIQMHRRTRAFKKLAETILKLKTGDEIPKLSKDIKHGSMISHKIVLNYLLPLAVQTLKGQDLSKHLHLRDACLEVVCNSAKIMPWSSYLKLLMQNMMSITKHSLGVKIICSILEAFHFDVNSITETQALSLTSIESNTYNVKADNSDSPDITSNPAQEIDEDVAKIYKSMTLDILPQLLNKLSGKMESDSEHKLANSTQYSDIDICNTRAPLAIAVASLLRKMPSFALKSYLPRIILKMNVLLRHRYFEIRSVASKTVTEIASLVGPASLHLILKELKSGLARGYQRHVLVYTVNSVIDKLAQQLKVGDLEKSLSLLLDILRDDLFGGNEEERAVTKIQTKTPEAKGRSRSYNIYKILSKYAKRESLLSIISPLKKVLDVTHDHKKRKIVESSLDEINQGLQENTSLTAEDILVFLHGLLTENMPVLFSFGQGSQDNKQNEKKKSFRPESCYLLSTEPERYGVKETKKTYKTNLHLIVEFALQYLHSALKRQLILSTEKKHLEMLDPFIVILKHCLSSAHTKSVTDATRCITRLFRFPLPSMELNLSEISKKLFTILREKSKGSVNDEIAAVVFKALSVLCICDLGSNLSTTQLEVLLAYSEEVLYEKHRQSHAFNLIRSILGRGLQCDEVFDVMKKIRDLCIQTHDVSAMGQARNVYAYFLGHYPMTKSKLSEQLEFVLVQLSYEHESGRVSALELLHTFISMLSPAMVRSNAGTIFLQVGTLLVNDEAMKCRKLAAFVIKALLQKLEYEDRDALFDFILQWYEDKDHSLHQQLAAMLITSFAETEEVKFTRRLEKVLPLILDVVTFAVEQQEDEVESGEVQRIDHQIFHQLSALHSIIQQCKLMHSQAHDKSLTSILKKVEELLLHPHAWVRLVSAQIFGSVFASWPAADLVKLSKLKKQQKCRYLTSELSSCMKKLSMKFCKQIEAPVLDAKLAEQSMKNLLFIVKVQYLMVKEERLTGSRIKQKEDSDSETRVNSEDEDDIPTNKDGISCLLTRLSTIAKREAAYNIKETSKRNAILKFNAAVCVSLEDLSCYLRIIVNPVYREMERRIANEDQVANELKNLATEVFDVIKTKVGSEKLTAAYAEVGKRVTGIRRERKRKLALQLVADPTRAAATKTRRQQKKKEQRKRKLASFNPEYREKLKRRKNI